MTARPQEVERLAGLLRNSEGMRIARCRAVAEYLLAHGVALSAPPEGVKEHYWRDNYAMLCDAVEEHLGDFLPENWLEDEADGLPAMVATVTEAASWLRAERNKAAPASPAPPAPLWQKCPVCDGQGLVNKPAHVAGDQATWTDAQAGPYPCRRCAGAGTIASPPRAPEGLREALRPFAEAVVRSRKRGKTAIIEVASLTDPRDWLEAERVYTALASEPAPPEEE